MRFIKSLSHLWFVIIHLLIVMEELQIGELPKHLDDQKFIIGTKNRKINEYRMQRKLNF